jgi:hypothetical protein
MGWRSDFPEPPWVQGPSEVNRWIDSKYPSKKNRSYLTKMLKARASSEARSLLVLKEVLKLLKKLGYYDLKRGFDDLATELLDGTVKFKVQGDGANTCKASIVKEEKKGDYLIELHFNPATNLRGKDKLLKRFKKKAAIKNIKF